MAVIQFAILGLGIGAVYVLVAQGIVLIYRGSGVVNFAQGAVGMITAQVFYAFRSAGWPAVPAIVLSLTLSAFVGIVMQLVVLRGLRNASALARLIATLGLLTFLAGLGQVVWGTLNNPVVGILPTGSVNFGAGVIIGQDRIVLIALGLAMTAALSLVYTRTRYGLATSAVAENQRAAVVLGWSPDLIGAANWAAGSVLAGVAGILLAPLAGLSVSGLVFMVMPALAAALVGRFSSFWLTVVGAFGVGIAQSEVTRFVSTPGWSDAVPFAVVAILMIVRGRSLPLRGEINDEAVRVGTGRVRPVVATVVAIFAVGVTLVSSASWQLALSTTAVTAIIALSLVVVTGYAGQLSLAQLMIAGVGAVGAGDASAHWDWPFPLCVLFGAVLALAVGLVVAVPSLRVRGVNLAVVTLGLSVVIQELVLNNATLTMNGQLSVNDPTLFGLDISYLVHPQLYAVFAVIMLALCVLVVTNVRRGSSGRRLLALRSNERAAAGCGVNVFAGKVFAFGLSAFIAGVGGAVLAFQFPIVNLAQFDTLSSINLLVQTVIGGIGYVGGAVSAGAAMPGGALTQILSSFGGSWTDYILMAGGALVIVTLLHHPQGISDTLARQVGGFLNRYRRKARRGGTPAVSAIADQVGTRRHALEVRNLSVQFGGVHAVSDMSVTVHPGEVVGLIGPNGAGKTTLIDAISGMVRSAGEVAVGGRRIDRLSPRRRVAVGVVRTFQAVELFDDLSVLDNIRVAAESSGVSRFLSDLVAPRARPLSGMALVAIRELGLGEVLNRPAGELSAGQRKLVGIARALATSPGILLLDEPAAGIGGDESRELGQLIRSLADRWHLAVLLIEHDVELVASVSHRVVAMALGKAVVEGEPAAVLRHPAVVSAYLGEEIHGEGQPQQPGEAARSGTALGPAELGRLMSS